VLIKNVSTANNKAAAVALEVINVAKYEERGKNDSSSKLG
jgi:hypothetical protein